jgi:hypothetical protein
MFPIKLQLLRENISIIWLLKRKNSNKFEGVELKVYPEKYVTQNKALIDLSWIRILVQTYDFELYVNDEHVTFEEFHEINKRG